MTTTETTERASAPASVDLCPQTAELVIALARQARALRFPTLCCAVLATGSALTVWLLSWVSFVADSFTSGVLCVGLLGLMAIPGALLFWVYASLRQVAALPARFQLPAEGIPSADLTVPIEPTGSFFARWFEVLNRRVEAVLDVWNRLSYYDGIRSSGGPTLFLAFLSRTASQVVIGAALVASALLALVAVFVVLRAVFGWLS